MNEDDGHYPNKASWYHKYLISVKYLYNANLSAVVNSIQDANKSSVIYCTNHTSSYTGLINV